MMKFQGFSGETMQCRSYLPVYQSDFDLNVDSNSRSKVMYDGNATFRSGLCNNLVSILQVPQSRFDYKELLWQTMLMHEVTFRDQVQELHRLYKRHRETITEIKSKQFHMKHVQMEIQSSTSSSPVLLSNGIQQTKSIQRGFHSTEEFKTPVVPLALRNDGTLEKLSGYKVKIIGGKPLDLELPAEVYIDSDEWDSLQESQFAEDPISANMSSTKHGKSVIEADGTVSGVHAPGQGDTLRTCSIQGTKFPLVDLNEPPTTLHPENGESHPEVLGSSCGSSDKKPSLSLENKPLVVQALLSLDSQSRSRKYGKYSRRTKWSVQRNLDFGPSSDKIVTDAVAEEKSAWAVQKHCMSEISMPCDIIVCTKQNSTNCADSLNNINLKKSKRCRVIDINLSCDRESDDEPLKAIDNVSLEGDKSLGELAEVAARAIVSMSHKIFSFSETTNCQHSQVSDSKTLEWFAGLVNDVGTLRLNEIDDFEVMTLNLSETKPEEYSSPGISSQACSPPVACTTRRGRTRRPKIKKDFQREVLPSLSSLSRYEVSEDMQMIEGLMEAAGTPWHLRARRACRMGRKPQTPITQQRPSTDVQEMKAEFRFSWGNDNKRPRGRRSRVSLDVIMSRWIEIAV